MNLGHNTCKLLFALDSITYVYDTVEVYITIMFMMHDDFVNGMSSTRRWLQALVVLQLTKRKAQRTNNGANRIVNRNIVIHWNSFYLHVMSLYDLPGEMIPP